MQIRIAKAGRDMTVDRTRFNETINEFIFEYGLRQILNDGHSQITEKAEPDPKARADKAWALSEKKLASLYAGETSARVTDPVMAEAMSMAMECVSRLPQFKGAKQKVIRAKALQYVDSFMERARERVEENEALFADAAAQMAEAEKAE